MLFKTALLATLLSLTGVNASCYGTGEYIEPTVGKGTVRQHISNACYGWSGNTGRFQNTRFLPYSQSPYPAEVKIYHYKSGLGIGYCIVLAITNLENSGRTLPQNYCSDGLLSEVNSCNALCESNKWGWKFRVDVNLGRC